MKERPILFNPEMVRAILAGCKTQTRRLLKPQPTPVDYHGHKMLRHPDLGGDFNETVFGHCYQNMCDCRYGEIGDRLWVRERWRENIGDAKHTVYYADFPHLDLSDDRWRPSIHMSRARSRITLEIVNVRVERLKDISYEDMKAEGAEYSETWDYYFNRAEHIEIGGGNLGDTAERLGWAGLWDSINGKTYPWESNPWVWVVEFKTLDTTGKLNQESINAGEFGQGLAER